MDVVWLKRGDIRSHDHGPLATAASSGRRFIILFVYEPEQLNHHTVHGSHILFCNESLVDLEKRLASLRSKIVEIDDRNDSRDINRERFIGVRKVVSVEVQHVTNFQCISLVSGEITKVLTDIHSESSIARLLSHQETGHFVSYQRDKRVRRWCRKYAVTFDEFPQTGVTRALADRDNFSKLYNVFMCQSEHPIITQRQLGSLERLPVVTGVMTPQQLVEAGMMHAEQADDRAERQHGGETFALSVLQSFLNHRFQSYSSHISSPGLSWMSCSRLSPYLSFGNVALRRVVQALTLQQVEARKRKYSGLASLAAFHSRLRWRSHFIQKLECEPEMEYRAQCLAFDKLRAESGDWNECYFVAWTLGRTGYPMVDACMRSLLKHGWVNFRMRAMLVSFACYNLFLDWKRIAPHLARCFLDYEPGIHYPQLQMQAGTTGINAMRVYNVVKQAKDQDPMGEFIRKYVPELTSVPSKYIHEPHLMSSKLQQEYKVIITPSEKEGTTSSDGNGKIIKALYWYPTPIVDADAMAKESKAKVNAIRKARDTKAQAKAVFVKHGSRMKRTSDFLKEKNKGKEQGQTSIRKAVKDTDTATRDVFERKEATPSKRWKQQQQQRGGDVVNGDSDNKLRQQTLKEMTAHSLNPNSFQHSSSGLDKSALAKPVVPEIDVSWICNTCTLVNTKPFAPVCEVCETPRVSTHAIS